MTSTVEAPAPAGSDIDARLTAYRRAALCPDRSLDAVLTFLRELAGRSTDHTDPLAAATELGALRGHLSFLVEDLCRDLDPHLRAAPFPEMTECLRECMVRCGNPACDQRLYPWGDAFCDNGGGCQTAAYRAFGEV